MEIRCSTFSVLVWLLFEVVLIISLLIFRSSFIPDINQTLKSSRNDVCIYEQPVSHLPYNSCTFKQCFYAYTFFNSLLKSNFERNALDTRNLKICDRLISLDSYWGRIGNQMFQVASLLGISFTFNLIPIFSPGTILNEYFDLPNVFNKHSRTLQHVSIYECKTFAKFCDFSEQMREGKGNVTVKGYFQSWKYFYNISDIIKLLFKFKNIHIEKAKRYLSSVSLNNFHRVCIHIRSGDFSKKSRLSKGYVMPKNSFFKKARQFYLHKFKFVQFIIVSDEKKWCSQNFQNVNISYFTNPGDDLALLSMCDHVVVTLGTFGWWGAWLSGGTTVYFDGFPKDGSLLELSMKKEDYYPPSWIGLS